MIVVRIGRLALEGEAIVLEIAVPLPQLRGIGSLRELGDGIAGPDIEQMPASHPHECSSRDWDV